MYAHMHRYRERERERERLLYYRLTNLVEVDSSTVKNIGPKIALLTSGYLQPSHTACTPETRKKRREESISYMYMYM